MKDFAERINTILKPKTDNSLGKTVIDLFAGCGGLSLGFEAQGFRTIGYEMDVDASATYNSNLLGECHTVLLTTETEYPEADIIIGGPPCQPFSVGGKQLGLKDSRDGFPIFIEAVRRVDPEVILFENVRGMLYKNKWYLQEVISELDGLGYNLTYSLLNARHYDVPQNRERIIVIGAKSRIGLPVKKTYQITAGEALGELATKFDENSKYLTPNMDKYIAKYEKASSCINPRDLHMDRPARTLTCRNLAGSTGDMHRIKLPNGKRRRITVREAARLQSFPDWFKFSGTETSQYNQVGNAVAPYFAYHLAGIVKQYYEEGFCENSILTIDNQYTLFENEAIYSSGKVSNI